ncbi:MAG: LacI family DNA-binding transcriptional regulator [Clostridia bacterium]|nr:LacI family DNA-binding transcriptional regulator [Clostridia bacterium]
MSVNSTIYDIAAEAGVSIATVSRVLRGERSVSPATREKVEAVIARRNYRPSSIARGMTSKTTHSLGIVLPKLLNPNYAMIFTGAYDGARRHGYSMNMFPWKSLTDQRSTPALLLAERRLDGVIICLEYLPPEENERLMRSLQELRQYMPIVLIGCVPAAFEYPTISYNMADIARSTVEYLVGLGHSKIALIGGVEADRDDLRRDVGYRQGLEEAQLPYVDSYRAYCGGTAEEGAAALDQMLSSLLPAHWPTAVIALNDLVAMGCQDTARKRGLRLPEDLSIVGCDNLFCAPYLIPALTSIDTHQQLLGQKAVELLLSGETRRENAAWTLVRRDSCAPCKSGEPAFRTAGY